MATSRRRDPPARPAVKADDRAGLRHELEVHQEELRAQNDKLREALLILEETRDRYMRLYDAAPTGYCTLDRNGFIQEINLCAAALLGRPRSALVGSLLLPSFAVDDRSRFLRYLKACARAKGDVPAGEELRLIGPRGERLVQLTCSPRRDGEAAELEYFVSLIDVTERRRLEQAREEARREHAALVQRMFMLQEAERRRIAQDIHDDLGQQVTGLRLKLEWLAASMSSDPKLREKLQTVQEAAARVDRHVDFLLRDLRPAGLDDFGLVRTLRQNVEDWSATFGIPAELHAGGLDDMRFPQDVETHAFRIAQEALNNVHKHAAATFVRVVFEKRQGRVTLTIGDNGIGLLASSAGPRDSRRGLGLLGMRERAALIGGELTLTAVPGSGTTVVLALP
jgi:PAS domain S-box-containing protein